MYHQNVYNQTFLRPTYNERIILQTLRFVQYAPLSIQSTISAQHIVIIYLPKRHYTNDEIIKIKRDLNI